MTERHSVSHRTRRTIQPPLVWRRPSLLRLLIYSGSPFNMAAVFINTELSFRPFLVRIFSISLHVSHYKKCSTAQLCEPTHSELFISVWS